MARQTQKSKLSGFRNNFKTIIFLFAILGLCSLFIFTNIFHIEETRKSSAITIGVLIASLTLTALFIIFIVSIFGTLKEKFGIYDFFIGDEGTYSLSRLQAVVWALVIISYQVSVMFSLLLNSHAHGLFYYEASFSESSIWLLGLSLGSCIAVKGIMTNKIISSPGIKNRKSGNPQWRDILMGENGLDFSKCQMLIWTIIALFAYLSKCYDFTYQLHLAQPDGITKLFNHFYEDYSADKNKADYSFPFVPYLPWTFVVLMGLSQGTYVGKKLVPTFKVQEAVTSRKSQLDTLKKFYEDQISLNNQLLNSANPSSPAGIQQINKIRQEQFDLELKLADINNEAKSLTN